MFAWDEAKRRADLRKHGIDFADAEKIFIPHPGLLEDQVVSVTHTERGDTIRIISIRKATKDETRFYFSQITD